MSNGAGETFSFVLDRFVQRSREKRLAPATIRNYIWFAEKLLKPKLGHLEVARLRTGDFEELFFEMGDRGFVPSTVQKCRVTASGALKLAQRQGWVERNVVTLAEGPKARQTRPLVPTPQEVHKFLEVAAGRDPDMHDFVRVMAATGIRLGEACGLRQDDLDGVRLQVARSIDSCEGVARVRQTKTDRLRSITVDESTAEIIRARPGRYVFGGSDPWRPDLTSKKMKRLCRVAAVRITPTSLRHFHATQLLASGQLNVKQVADRLGHANPGETLRTYAHFIPSLDEVAAKVMERVLQPPEE